MRLRVRRAERSDVTGIVRLMELNGLPRWTAYEEGNFLVVEGTDGILGAASLRGNGDGGVVVGSVVVDPWCDEAEVAVAIYRWAAEFYEGREVVLSGITSRKAVSQAGYVSRFGVWRRDTVMSHGGGSKFAGKLLRVFGRVGIPGL